MFYWLWTDTLVDMLYRVWTDLRVGLVVVALLSAVLPDYFSYKGS